jgi:hypothetical protein
MLLLHTASCSSSFLVHYLVRTTTYCSSSSCSYNGNDEHGLVVATSSSILMLQVY